MIILPLTYSTDVLNEDQLEFLAKHLPYPKAQTGRPAYTNQELLPGILKILRSGSRWRDLDRKDLPSGITHWRRLRYWQEKSGFDDLWQYLLKILLRKKKLKLKVASIDGTLIPGFNFKELTSYSGKHHRTGTKVSLAVDCLGIPLSKILAVGSAHDRPLAIPTIENIPAALTAEIRKMLADKGYDNSH
ncbi:transposase, partial [Patescibacteria group bacterium]|nr:transposase [Patescibacteria group bacterium]